MPGTENLELLLSTAPALSVGLAAGIWFRFVSTQGADTQMAMSGFAAARHILESAGITDVTIEPTPGSLSDHYDSGERSVRLSGSVYHGRSAVAFGVAARIAGHALQHRARPLAILVQNIASIGAAFGCGPGLFIAAIGFLFGQLPLVWIGVALFHVAFVLQVVCLPLRLDACRRARKTLANSGLLDATTARSVERIMRASALMTLAVVLQPIVVLTDAVTGFFGGARSD